jgi:hypothetical protein
MEAHAELARRVDRVLERYAVREEVQVIGDGRRAAQQELGQAERCTHAHRLAIQRAPNRVEQAEPIEQSESMARSNRAREGLVEVMMSVDEPGQHHGPSCVNATLGSPVLREPEHFGAHLGGRPDRFDRAVADEDAAPMNFAPRAVHREHDVRVGDQERCHA